MGIKRRLNDMKINKRLMLSYLVVLSMLVVGIIVSISNLVSIGGKIEKFYEHPFKVSAAANTINASFEEMQKSVFRALSTEDPAITAEAIQDAKNAATIIQENMSTVSDLFLGDHAIVDSLQASLTKLAPMREEVLNMASQNHNKEAAAYMEANNIPVIMEAQTYLDELINTADESGLALIAEVQGFQALAVVVLIILGAFSVVVSLLFAKVITDSIKNPVSELETIAQNLATGKLDAEAITYEAKDEIGRAHV